MANICDAKQTLALEKKAIEVQKITIEQLMDLAGRALADEVKFLQGLIVIVCGKGNNAGDGFVAARNLIEDGAQVKVLMLYDDSALSGEALEAYRKLPKEIIFPFEQNLAILKKADVIVDAIFGFSFKPPIKEYEGKAIQAINKQNSVVIAADVPSGLEASTGEAQESKVIEANKTLCFSCLKAGLLKNKGPVYAGKIKTVDIGIDPSFAEAYSMAQTIEPEYVKDNLPKRNLLTHKKSVGRTLVVAGSAQFSGAAVLTAESALRTGAGLVTLAVPAGIKELIQQKATPEIIIVGLAQTDELTFANEAVEPVLKLLDEHDVLAIGPGLTTQDGTQQFVQELLPEVNKPVVVDADALTALAVSRESGVGSPDNIFNKINTSVVLTPHEGELARLIDLTAAEIEEDRFQSATKLASDNITVLLKGRYSVISSKQKTMVNMTSNPGMATAGTGDVLTGMVSALIAQGLSNYEAATVGTFLHGLAGDLAAEELSEYSLIATDIIEYLPKAFNSTRRVD